MTNWKDLIRSRIANNASRLTHLTAEQRASLIEDETAAAIFCTEAGLPLMSAEELKMHRAALRPEKT